ncbi:hypothetical protein F2Q70_00002652 [Brassica cretica]|uniref:Uncharacterized protein n=1 Tax=Brassica cretica TaxID=69181 RepID=A0A8S9FY17_BRACR|nr:hypothetical protein F2Q68_00020603 [Brassica cretica]KAF2574688.1 hypothetical protein F2Q70_00002652 [Brassica cretica]
MNNSFGAMYAAILFLGATNAATVQPLSPLSVLFSTVKKLLEYHNENMSLWQVLSFLTSPIGNPSRLHPETAQCLNLDVAKIFVNVDLTKKLPTRMNFNVLGEDELEEGEIWGENNKEEEIERVEVQEIEVVENGGGAIHVEVPEKVEIQEGDKRAFTKEISQDPEKEKEWLDVSLGKSSRPLTPLKFGQVSILTKSRFEVLSPTEEQEAIEEERLEQT